MALRSERKNRSHMPRGFGSRHVSSVSFPAFRSMALLNKRENVNRTRSRCSNSVHPSVPTSRSLKARALTAGCERTQEVSDPAAPSYQNYVVKVRVLHGIDLYIPHMKAACQHVACPTVNITLNKNPMQSSTAAQHARNHSIWKKHELTFRVNDVHQVPPQSGMAKEVAPSPFISMFVSLSFIPCTCSSKTCEKMPPSILIGEVGELQLPVNESEKYEISRFFPVIRRQHQNAQSVFVLLPAGKIKLSIYVELEKPVSVVVQPKRPPFALPTNFGEALQLKRKQLKVTVVPEDITSQKAPQIDLIAPGLLQEIAVETAQDHLDAGDLEIKSRIGEGIHSCVSLGNLSQRNNNLTQQVAVKEFRHQHALPPVNVLRAFQQEYRLLERCRRQNGHQHIVDLLGVILEPRLIIVMEYFSRGSLAQCLQDEAAWGAMSIKQKAVLGLKIAQGMAWIHKHGIIHRDIKSHNILVGSDLVTKNPSVKIGDLGSAVMWQNNEPPLIEEVGSSGYTAPEIFTQQGYNSKIDVWSFGVVLWELASRCPQDRINAFMGMAGEEFVKKAKHGCRPQLAHPHQLCLRPVIEKCWRFDPSERPTMDEVVLELEALCSEL